MSRRQRRKSSSSAKSKKRSRSSGAVKTEGKKWTKGLWWKLPLSVAVIILGLVIFTYIKAQAFLKSDEFRDLASEKVNDELGVEGGFSNFSWDGMSGENEKYKSTGEGLIQMIEMQDLSFDVDLNFIKRDVFKIREVNIDNINSKVDLTKEFIKTEREVREKGFLEKLLPEKVELHNLEVYDFNSEIVTAGDTYYLRGVRANIERGDRNKAYSLKVEGGRIKFPLGITDELQIESANIKLKNNEVYINSVELTLLESGKVELNGFLDIAKDTSKRYELDGKLSGLKCKDVFPSNWQKNLKGEVLTSFSIVPHTQNLPLVKGHFEIHNGTLEALPILSKMAHYLADSKYRTIQFEKFECDVKKYEDQITLSNILLNSKNLLKVEGDITFNGKNLDGLFQVGLPPEKLSNIPGAETHVFSPGKDNFSWATVKITGTVDDIKQDLTNRLIEAAGRRMVEQFLELSGEGLNAENVNKALETLGVTGDAAKPLLKSMLESGAGDAAIDAAADTAKDLLNGGLDLLNRGSSKEGSEQEEENSGRTPLPIPDPSKVLDLLPF